MIILVLAVFGIIFGSFVNALVWRMYEQDLLEGMHSKAALKRRRQLSISRGRSICPNCSHELAAEDLVPLLSWFWLRGHCRYCHKGISWQYPFVEALTGGLFVLSYFVFPFELHGLGMFRFICWLTIIVVFVALAVYDLRWYILPDKLILPATAVATLLVVVVAIAAKSAAALWQPVLGAVVIFSLFYLLFQVSKGAWIGGGDVKLAIVLGLLVGSPIKAFLVIFLSSLFGTLVSLPAVVRNKQGMGLKIPFGPYLLVATVVVFLWGTPMINWYHHLFLI